ncbi:MAG: phosphodiester glycosidase family protein [Acidimicrobiales bacterium]
MPHPASVPAFAGYPLVGGGRWRPAGRLVDGQPAILTTLVRLPGPGTTVAGIAWMDTPLLRARLYSGSLSPGGLFWKYTAPISRGESRALVAAFNGGFLLKVSHGGYLSEGHLVAPLRAGAASLVIYRDGSMTVGAWGRDVTMGANVAAVRQNLTLLVDGGRIAPGLNPNDVAAWGASLNQVVDTWRSGLGVTSTGALVYVAGPMNIVELAQLLVRAGAVRAMTLDMNPLWPVFATYEPASPTGYASPGNGTDLVPTMVQSPARFFEAAYSRDFITISTR